MEFYFDIKAKENSSREYSDWSWPPIWSGKISAESKANARVLINEEYGRSFIMRFSKKNPDEPFLLSIKEMTPYLTKRFEVRICEVCENEFTINEKYITGSSGSNNVCNDDCFNKYQSNRRAENSLSFDRNDYLNPPVIYKITNIQTDMDYIGKSIRSFTLRWWEHIKAGKLSSENQEHCFYKAIKESSLIDWTYQVIEVIEKYPEACVDYLSKERHITERESYWIEKYDSVNNGYNSVISNKNQKETTLQIFNETIK